MSCPESLPGKPVLPSLLIWLLVATLGTGVLNVKAQSTNDLVVAPNAGQAVSARPLSSVAPIAKNRQFTVVLKLSDDPVAVVRSRMPGKRLRDEDAQAIARRLRAKQDALVPAIEARSVPVLARFQYALNGIKIRATANQIAALSRLPGVVQVKQVGTYQLNNAESVPFIGTPSVWAGPPGLHGEHIKVAILDTGIDYTHADFGGPGTIAAFQAAKATNTQPPDPTLFGPNAPKVKGGTDLVGDNYTGSNTPVPDPNPLDCSGHGSHVAGTAVGFGVLADGSTFQGPYDSSTPSHSFIIGPGVAPMADLYSVRVFGCTGSTNVVVDGIEWAVANGMQVISMSLGGNFGSKNTAEAEAATNAENAGIIVVAASGNAGPVPYITSSPADGDQVISVAAMESHATLPAINFALSTGTSITAFENNLGVTIQDETALGIFVLRNSDGSVSLGCNDSEYVDSLIEGKMVVAMRGFCTFASRLQSAQFHGAAALTLINNAPGFPANVTQPFPGITIPFFTVQGSPSSDGLSLTSASSVTLTNVPVPNPTFRTMASFTSSGPRLGDGFLKPDVTAPGVNIFSTASGTGNQGETLSGTSMATPHVAGVSALALQAHPAWDPDAVRLAVVNTSDPTQLAAYSTKLAGAGLVQPLPATLTSVIARSGNDAPSLSFGLVEFPGDFETGGDVTLENLGTQAATFNVSTNASQGSSPHTVNVSSSAVTVPASGTATVHLTLNIPSASNGDSSAFRDVGGVVTFTPATPNDNAGVTLNLPYYAVSRARSEITTSIGSDFGSGNNSTAALVSNVSPSVAGTARFFSWGLTGQHADLGFFGLRAVGVESFNDNTSRNVVRFAVSTFAPLGYVGIGQYEIVVNVYLNGHTSPDYEIFTEDYGLATTGTYSGQVGAFIYHVATNTTTISFLASAPTDGSTVLLPVYASDIALSAVSPRFSYNATIFSVLNPDFSLTNALLSDSISDMASFNAFDNSISTGSLVAVGPGSSTTVPLSIDANEFSLTPAKGVMVVSLDNASGASQAQLLPLPGGPAVLQSITVAPASASVPGGEMQAFTATGNYSDTSTQDLTSAVTWSSSDTTVATINASGLATGVKAGGPVTIKATQGSVFGTAQLTVTANNVSVTINTSPAGESFSVDGTSYLTAQTLTWTSGSTHTIGTTSPQSGGPGTQFTWLSWSDGGDISHQVTAPNSTVTYTANFSTQFQLLTSASPAGEGSVTPSSGNYYDAGTVVNLTANASAGFTFTGWTGNVADPKSSATTVTMNAPQSVAANFAPLVPATVIDYRVLFGSESYSLFGSTRNRLPWQIIGIQIVFSKPITTGDANSLSGVTTTGFTGLGTNTLTWSINRIVVGNVATALATAGSDALTDATGTPVAPFSENFRVLNADYNDDGAVTSADMVAVNNARSAPYNIFADLNGDGLVDLNDVQMVRSRIGTTLP